MQVSVSNQCHFKHPDFSGPGRWYGVCHNGVASGRGYGLVMNERGDSVEFIGEAKKGLASGSGGMIIQRREQVGATYFEGGFKNGLPDGVVRVEKAGETPKLRQFRAGVDVGKASAADLQSLNFASSLVAAGALIP